MSFLDALPLAGILDVKHMEFSSFALQKCVVSWYWIITSPFTYNSIWLEGFGLPKKLFATVYMVLTEPKTKNAQKPDMSNATTILPNEVTSPKRSTIKGQNKYKITIVGIRNSRLYISTIIT